MNELFGLIVLLLAAKLGPDVHAATAANAYVTVSCSTYGVEDIVRPRLTVRSSEAAFGLRLQRLPFDWRRRSLREGWRRDGRRRPGGCRGVRRWVLGLTGASELRTGRAGRDNTPNSSNVS